MHTMENQSKILKISDGVEKYLSKTGEWYIWNKYKPNVTKANNDLMQFIDYIFESNNELSFFVEYNEIIEKLISANILTICEGSQKELFIQKVECANDFLNKQIDDVYLNKYGYVELDINNSSCNLVCPYCIHNFIKGKTDNNKCIDPKHKYDKLVDIVDQFFNRKMPSERKQPRAVFFNGGEFLIEYNILQKIVTYIKNKYKNEEIEFGINTNATLITDDRAKWLSEHFSKISISIDGDFNSNNKTRKYHSGAGAYDDIVSGIYNLNKYLKSPIEIIQGTFQADDIPSFDDIQKLQKYGFKNARFGINLLGIDEETAIKAAEKYIDLWFKCRTEKFRISDAWLDSLFKKMYSGDLMKEFYLYCNGLGELAGKTISYNIDTETCSSTCSYAPDSLVYYNNCDCDIYNKKILNKTKSFLEKRFQNVKNDCIDCDMVGFCRGGCFFIGLDSYNSINKSACAFLRSAWHRLLDYQIDFTEKFI